MDIRSDMIVQLKSARVQLEKVSEELASGVQSEYTTADYKKKLQLEDQVSKYTYINENLNLIKSQNISSDTAMSEIKDIVSAINAKVIAAGTDTVSDEGRDIIVRDIKSYKDSIIDQLNSEVMFTKLFAGDNKSQTPFSYTKDANGNYTDIVYEGSIDKFAQRIDTATTKEQGVTGLNVMGGLVDSDGVLKYNELGQEVDANGDLVIDATTGEIQVLDINNQPEDLTLKVIYEIDQAIEAIDNNEIIANTDGRSIGGMSERIGTEVYDKINLQHAYLGSSNEVFIKLFDQNSVKLLDLKVTDAQLNEVDITEATLRLQQIELMYQSMFSTLRQINEIEENLINSLF